MKSGFLHIDDRPETAVWLRLRRAVFSAVRQPECAFPRSVLSIHNDLLFGLLPFLSGALEVVLPTRHSSPLTTGADPRFWGLLLFPSQGVAGG